MTAQKNQNNHVANPIDSDQIIAYNARMTELNEERKQLKILVEAGLAGIAIIKDMRIEFANSTLVTLLGYSDASEMRGKSMIELVFDQDIDLISYNFQTESPFEITMKKKDGTLHLVEMSSRELNVHGETKRIVTIRDIKSRKQAEKDLQESEDRYKTLFDAAPQGILVLKQGICQFSNSAFIDLFGFKSSYEIVGMPEINLLSPEVRETLPINSLDQVLGEGESPAYETIGLKKDGSEFPVLVEAKKIMFENEPSLMVFFSDLTESRKRETEKLRYTSDLIKLNNTLKREINEKKKVEKFLEIKTIELSRSNEDLEQFAYFASHDLKEPLGVIASYAELIHLTYRDILNPEGKRQIQAMLNGTVRMQALISDLLTYSRFSTDTIEIQEIDTKAVLIQVMMNLQKTIEGSNSEIIFDALPKVKGEQTGLTQLFQNLISNGIKFNNNVSPKIKIISSEQEDCWLFSISDNGLGIENQYFKKIFGNFQRLHNRSEYGGTGIGLAICKRVVERYGGKIWVESILGEGSTFYFTLPK